MNDLNSNKLFCQIAIKLGFITKNEALEALKMQITDSGNGIKKYIGDYLLEKKILNVDQIQIIIDYQQKILKEKIDNMINEIKNKCDIIFENNQIIKALEKINDFDWIFLRDINSIEIEYSQSLLDKTSKIFNEINNAIAIIINENKNDLIANTSESSNKFENVHHITSQEPKTFNVSGVAVNDARKKITNKKLAQYNLIIDIIAITIGLTLIISILFFILPITNNYFINYTLNSKTLSNKKNNIIQKQYNGDPNIIIGDNKISPLIIATQNNDIETIKLLINNNANINYSDYYGNTALMYACIYNNEVAAKILLENKVNTDICNKSFLTAIDYAKSRLNNKIIDLLIKAGAKNLSKDDAIKILASNNIEFEISNFYIFLDLNNLKIIKLFLIAGVNPNINVKYSFDTILSNAVLNNNFNLMELLVEFGADVNKESGNGFIPLRSAKNDQIALYLVRNGSKMNKFNSYLGDELTFSVGNNFYETSKYLLSKGYNPNTTITNDGKTILILAIDKNNFAITKLLIDYGANYEIKCGLEQITPLMLASAKGQMEIVKLLVEKGAQIETQNLFGATAILIAQSNDHADIANYLCSIVNSKLNNKIDNQLIK